MNENQWLTSPSSSESDGSSLGLCQICNQPAHGNHFGAITCRACAAFFRRAIIEKYADTVKCRSEDPHNCPATTKRGKFFCKKCRLEKCLRFGMTTKNVQLGRDAISTTIKSRQNQKVVKSFESFVGRPHFILFLNSSMSPPSPSLNYVDVTYLLEKANAILFNIQPVQIFNQQLSSLEKMTFALSEHRTPKAALAIANVYGKNEALVVWENYFLQVAKWFTYCDEFQKLQNPVKMEIIKSIWLLWNRLLKLTMTADLRKSGRISENSVMITNQLAVDFNRIQLDISWCSNYANDEIRYFTRYSEELLIEEVMNPLMELQPTDTELTFMLSQICFNVIGKKFQGEILKLCENILEILANDLHQYYMNERKMPRYSGRLAQMLKINQSFEKNSRFRKETSELAKVFDIFTLTLSHPNMFNL